MSETAKYRALVLPYINGCGIDVGCGSEKIVPESIGIELVPERYKAYTGQDRSPCASIETMTTTLPFRDGSLDYVYSSHLLEDFADWYPVLREWVRVLRKGGRLIVIIPDKQLFAEALKHGQAPNDNHRHEGKPGEIGEHLNRIGRFHVLRDSRTSLFDGDYSILCVSEKL